MMWMGMQIDVWYDSTAGYWVAACDDLQITVAEKTYPAMLKTLWALIS